MILRIKVSATVLRVKNNYKMNKPKKTSPNESLATCEYYEWN
jgi:hypothetical protein